MAKLSALGRQDFYFYSLIYLNDMSEVFGWFVSQTFGSFLYLGFPDSLLTLLGSIAVPAPREKGLQNGMQKWRKLNMLYSFGAHGRTDS